VAAEYVSKYQVLCRKRPINAGADIYTWGAFISPVIAFFYAAPVATCVAQLGVHE